MKKYNARMSITRYYDVIIDAQDEDDAYDIADDLDSEEIMDGGLVDMDIDTVCVDEVDMTEEV